MTKLVPVQTSTPNKENSVHRRPIGSHGGSESTTGEYRYWERPNLLKKTNLFESVGHLIKSCLGGGIVGVHSGYAKCGLWTALVLNAFLGFLVAYCMYVLVKIAHKIYGRVKQDTMSYPDVAEATFAVSPFKFLQNHSKCARYAVDVVIMVDLFGSCCVYEVIIASSFRSLYESIHGFGTAMNIRLVILCLLIPLILICMILSLKYLAPFSVVADAYILIVVFTTVYYAIRNQINNPFPLPAFKDFSGMLQFIGMVVFSMEGVGVTMPIENSMADGRKMWMVVLIGMFFVVSLVMLAGFFGYFGFGEFVLVPITNAFPDNYYSRFLRIGMMCMIYVTFALNFWVPFNLLWVYLKKLHKDTNNPNLWERIYRAICVTIITCISIAFPDIDNFMGLIGAVCLSFMGFIFPATLEVLVDWSDPGLGRMKWRLWKSISINVFGFFVLFLSSYQNGKELLAKTFGVG